MYSLCSGGVRISKRVQHDASTARRAILQAWGNGHTQAVAHQTPDTSPAPLSAATSTHLTVSDSGNSEFLDFDLPVGFAVQPVSATV